MRFELRFELRLFALSLTALLRSQTGLRRINRGLQSRKGCGFCGCTRSQEEEVSVEQ